MVSYSQISFFTFELGFRTFVCSEVILHFLPKPIRVKLKRNFIQNFDYFVFPNLDNK